MTVYIVFNYDDGVLGVYSSESAAKAYIYWAHEQGYYHEEDCQIIIEQVKD